MTKLTFDPLMIPVEAVAGEPALVRERMSADWLRQRFMRQIEWYPENADYQLSQHAGRKPHILASVLIPIIMHAEEPTLLFTQRAAHLSDHAGQVSFPGGHMEPSDLSLIDTALREAQEEIGLTRNHVEVIGMLPEYCTSTGYQVTPVVCLMNPSTALRADPSEVAEIFEVPLAFLMNGLNHQLRTIVLPNGDRHTFYTMPYGRFLIWGATAAMLRNLFHFLRA